MKRLRLPPPPRRRFGHKIETRRSCGDAAAPGGRKESKRRVCAGELPNRDAYAFRLVGEVVLDSRAREMHDADWQECEHGVVTLEGRCFSVRGPVGLERELWHLPGGRPFGGD